VNQAVAVITTTPELSADYLVLYLISPPAQRYFLEVQVEMARPNISLENLRDMEVPAPPIDEQDRIADELKRNSGKAALLRCAIQQGCEEIELLSASILSEAF
jgi:restriction endonuclease S subunit